jgi:hypothetical protein
VIAIALCGNSVKIAFAFNCLGVNFEAINFTAGVKYPANQQMNPDRAGHSTPSLYKHDVIATASDKCREPFRREKG